VVKLFILKSDKIELYVGLEETIKSLSERGNKMTELERIFWKYVKYRASYEDEMRGEINIEEMKKEAKSLGIKWSEKKFRTNWS